MSRRFTYLNTLNSLVCLDYKLRRSSHTAVTLRKVARMRKYERLGFRFITKHQKRKLWKHRKHYFNYVVYLNILSLWSTEYVFFRKLIKFNYNYCIFKSTLLVHNLALLRNSHPATAKDSENTYLATLPQTLLYYFWKTNVRHYKFWLNSIEASLTVGSYSVNTENTQKQVFKTYLMNPCYFYNSSTMYTYSDEIPSSTQNPLSTYYDTIADDFYEVYLVEFYKLHILLALSGLTKDE